MRGMLAALLALTCLQAAAPARGADFWRSIAQAGYAVPAGESAAGLLAELDELFAARDPKLRDDLGYGIAEQWILRRRLLAPQEARALTATWTAWLGRGLGERGTDTVLVRAFAALDLSLLAALDLEAPFLDEAGFAALLDGALDALANERDLRGWEEGLGWVHATAHSADLLKFLARNPRLDEDGQARLLEGVARRAAATEGYVFAHDEDERLAQAVLSVLAREDLSRDAFTAFLELCREPLDAPGGEFDAQRHAARRNTRNLLRAVHERLLFARELPPQLAEPRAALQELLRAYADGRV
jgi:hypothetical protein